MVKGWFFSFKNLWYQKIAEIFQQNGKKLLNPTPPKKNHIIPNFVPIFWVEKNDFFFWKREILVKISNKIEKEKESPFL